MGTLDKKLLPKKMVLSFSYGARIREGKEGRGGPFFFLWGSNKGREKEGGADDGGEETVMG